MLKSLKSCSTAWIFTNLLLKLTEEKVLVGHVSVR